MLLGRAWSAHTYSACDYKKLSAIQWRNRDREQEELPQDLERARALQARDIPVTYVLFPDEGHGFVRPENRLAFTAVAEAFLAANLGGRFEPVGESFEGSSVTVPVGASDVGGVEEALSTKT